MQQRDIEIINKLGLHARAAAKFVTLASQYSSSIQVARGGQQVNGKSIMGVMMLAAAKGSSINITADGEDEEAAIQSLQELIQGRFGENE
ncbi:MAG: HPr family phosphocarrier protein [Gammaproteobacteria bacterium]